MDGDGKKITRSPKKSSKGKLIPRKLRKKYFATRNIPRESWYKTDATYEDADELNQNPKYCEKCQTLNNLEKINPGKVITPDGKLKAVLKTEEGDETDIEIGAEFETVDERFEKNDLSMENMYSYLVELINENEKNKLLHTEDDGGTTDEKGGKSRRYYQHYIYEEGRTQGFLWPQPDDVDGYNVVNPDDWQPLLNGGWWGGGRCPNNDDLDWMEQQVYRRQQGDDGNQMDVIQANVPAQTLYRNMFGDANPVIPVVFPRHGGNRYSIPGPGHVNLMPESQNSVSHRYPWNVTNRNKKLLELIFLHFFQYMLSAMGTDIWDIFERLGGNTKAIVYGGAALTYTLDPDYFKGTSPDIDVFLYKPENNNYYDMDIASAPNVARWTVYNKNVLREFTRTVNARLAEFRDGYGRMGGLMGYINSSFDIDFCTYRLVASPLHEQNIGKVCAVYKAINLDNRHRPGRIKYLPILDIGNWKEASGSIIRGVDHHGFLATNRLVRDLDADYGTIDPGILGFYKIFPNREVYSRSPQLEIDKLKLIIYKDYFHTRPKRSKRLRRIADYYNGMARERGVPVDWPHNWGDGVDSFSQIPGRDDQYILGPSPHGGLIRFNHRRDYVVQNRANGDNVTIARQDDVFDLSNLINRTAALENWGNPRYESPVGYVCGYRAKLETLNDRLPNEQGRPLLPIHQVHIPPDNPGYQPLNVRDDWVPTAGVGDLLDGRRERCTPVLGELPVGQPDTRLGHEWQDEFVQGEDWYNSPEIIDNSIGNELVIPWDDHRIRILNRMNQALPVIGANLQNQVNGAVVQFTNVMRDSFLDYVGLSSGIINNFLFTHYQDDDEKGQLIWRSSTTHYEVPLLRNIHTKRRIMDLDRLCEGAPALNEDITLYSSKRMSIFMDAGGALRTTLDYATLTADPPVLIRCRSFMSATVNPNIDVDYFSNNMDFCCVFKIRVQAAHSRGLLPILTGGKSWLNPSRHEQEVLLHRKSYLRFRSVSTKYIKTPQDIFIPKITYDLDYIPWNVPIVAAGGYINDGVWQQIQVLGGRKGKIHATTPNLNFSWTTIPSSPIGENELENTQKQLINKGLVPISKIEIKEE